MYKKRKIAKKWKHDYGPLVKAKFDEQKDEAVEWEMVWNGDGGCEIKKGPWQFTVNLEKRECSCRLWQITGIPCAHACRAIYHNGDDPDDFLHYYYSKKTYLETYKYNLEPINGSHEWVQTGLDPIQPPPPREKKLGRPKKNRRKSKDEPKKKGKLSRKWTVIHCSLCSGKGHNQVTCPTKVPEKQVSLKTYSICDFMLFVSY